VNSVMDEALQFLAPVAPGPSPPEQQVQEEVELLRQVVADSYGYALVPDPFTDARPVRIADYFARYPAPTVLVTRGGVTRELVLVDVPRGDLWGVELDHGGGRSTLAAYYWNNEAGFQFFAYISQATAQALADSYLLRQEEAA